MKKIFLFCLITAIGISGFAQKDSTLKKKDRKRDVLIQTNYGDMVIRLSDSTPLHRDNFLKLVKVDFFDSLLFHRVIEGFMIQGGDPTSKGAAPGLPLGSGGPGYLVPAELRTSLFHKKGTIAAARRDNPQKSSNGSQFYITQGKVYTQAGLDSLVQFRMPGRIFTAAEREAYTTVGGVPFLDQGYTVFGEMVSGYDVLDAIAAVPTSKAADKDRPIKDVIIKKMKLIKRKKTKK